MYKSIIQQQLNLSEGEGGREIREMAGPGTLDPVGPIASVGVTVASARLEAIECLDRSKTDKSLKGLLLPSGGNGNSSASLSLFLTMRPLPVHHPFVSPVFFLMYSCLSELTNMPRLVMLAPGPLPCYRPALPTIPFTHILTP